MKQINKIVLSLGWAIVPLWPCQGASIIITNTNAYALYVWSSHSPEFNSPKTAIELQPGQKVHWKAGLKTFRDINWRDTKFHTNFTVDLSIPWWHTNQHVEIFSYGMYRSLYHGDFLKRALVLTSTETHSLLQHLIVKFLL